MRQIFRDDDEERRFCKDGIVTFDLLEEPDIAELLAFYADAFRARRPVSTFAEKLPYYISVFDRNTAHKREVDALVSSLVARRLGDRLIDYEIFYSNFMIKFPGDGRIEAHQDFNFVDESRFVAFNLWCPLVDTHPENGGLFVIPGSHGVFRTQRGPNFPKALTEHDALLQRHAQWLPVKRGTCAIFDHKTIHGSWPNRSSAARIAIQSVLKPREARAVHYVFDAPTGRARAYAIDKDFIVENDLWSTKLEGRPVDHEQALVPLPNQREVKATLSDLRRARTSSTAARRPASEPRRVLSDPRAQASLDGDGFAVLPLLRRREIELLSALFLRATGGRVTNTAYGMYIGLEEEDLAKKRALIREICALVLPSATPFFLDTKPHLGSFLVKAPGASDYTYPHQDWTFVDGPEYRSMTVWIALTDTDEDNGALGFIPGSHRFFDRPIGSPSPAFRTPTQGHEATLYEYLRFVPLLTGEAVVFDNRTIHGAPPNRRNEHRTAVAIGMTPREAQLHHYHLVPGTAHENERQIAKLRVTPEFFERHTVAGLRALYDAHRMPEGCEIDEVFTDELVPMSSDEVRRICEQAGAKRNGHRLERTGGPGAERPWLGRIVRALAGG